LSTAPPLFSEAVLLVYPATACYTVLHLPIKNGHKI
jgi:hypothetical protein